MGISGFDPKEVLLSGVQQMNWLSVITVPSYIANTAFKAAGGNRINISSWLISGELHPTVKLFLVAHVVVFPINKCHKNHSAFGFKVLSNLMDSYFRSSR